MTRFNISKPHPPGGGPNPKRPTAAIDRAWNQQDAEGVEQALNDYAREDEQVLCLIVENSRPVSTEFYLEPWAENVTLAPQAKVRVFLCEPKHFGLGYSLDHRTHIIVSHDSIVLYAPTGEMADQKPTAQKCELIEPNAGDKRYVRRDDEGKFTEDQVDVSKSLRADVRQTAKTKVSEGQGDKGDRKPS